MLFTINIDFNDNKTFFILNGDHRIQLAIHALIGLKSCLKYVKENMSQVNAFTKDVTMKKSTY